MSLLGQYDNGNVFARILRGEIPCHRIFEDPYTLAFMDKFPQSRGHCLVIPKRCHARNLLEIDSENLNAVLQTVQKLARAAVAALKPDGVQIFQMNGAAAGQTVFHLHVHIVPRWNGESIGFHRATEADAGELDELAARIAAEIR